MTTANFAQITASQVLQFDDQRQRIERVLALAEHLGDDDRLLVEQVYQHGMSPAEIACLLGKRTRTVRCRLRQILEDLQTPEFRYMVLRGHRLPPPTRQVGQVVVLHRCSLRRAAARLACSLHHVRQHMQIIQTLSRL